MKFQLFFTLLLAQLTTIAFTQWSSKNNPAGVDTYTENEFQKIPKLRERAKDVLSLPHMYENGYLVRYLRVADWDLQEAEAKLRENSLWRKKYNLDEGVNPQFFEFWQRKLPYYINFDRQGRLGLVASLMSLDVRQLVSSGKMEDCYKFYMHVAERAMRLLPQVSNATGKEFAALNVLYNDAGFNNRQHMCILSPRIWDKLFAIIKPHLTHRALSLFTIYGVDKSEWQPALLKNYSADQLTTEFGGTIPQLRWNTTLLPGNNLLSPKKAKKGKAFTQ